MTDGEVEERMQRYREFSNLVEERRPELVTPENTDLLTLVREANGLLDQEQTATERRLDAHLFRSLTLCGDDKGRRVSMGTTPKTPQEIIRAVQEKYRIEQPRLSLELEDGDDGGEAPLELDWQRFGDDLAGLMNCPPGMTCMRGFMIPFEKKERPKRGSQRREKPADAAKEPERHAARDREVTSSETDRIVGRLWEILQREEHLTEGVPLEGLTLDPDSYPQTAMNVFYLMFLVRDLRAGLAQEGDKMVVKSLPQSRGRLSGVERRQMVISMGLPLWKKWGRDVKRERCWMIDGRPTLQASEGNRETEMEVATPRQRRKSKRPTAEIETRSKSPNSKRKCRKTPGSSRSSRRRSS